ncbi:MAG: hypothetical protein ACRDIC_19565 [bacterium]
MHPRHRLVGMRTLTRDYFLTVNHHWLDAYHVVGFGYDCVPNPGTAPTGRGTPTWFPTYQESSGGGSGHRQRFFDGGRINLVQ